MLISALVLLVCVFFSFSLTNSPADNRVERYVFNVAGLEAESDLDQ